MQIYALATIFYRRVANEQHGLRLFGGAMLVTRGTILAVRIPCKMAHKMPFSASFSNRHSRHNSTSIQRQSHLQNARK